MVRGLFRADANENALTIFQLDKCLLDLVQGDLSVVFCRIANAFVFSSDRPSVSDGEETIAGPF
jgi:hypothetical protein